MTTVASRPEPVATVVLLRTCSCMISSAAALQQAVHIALLLSPSAHKAGAMRTAHMVQLCSCTVSCCELVVRPWQWVNRRPA